MAAGPKRRATLPRPARPYNLIFGALGVWADLGGVASWGTAKLLVDEAIIRPLRLPGASMLFYRAALPLSRTTLDYLAGVVRRHCRKIGSCCRKLTPAKQALLVLAHLRTGRPSPAWRPDLASAPRLPGGMSRRPLPC